MHFVGILIYFLYLFKVKVLFYVCCILNSPIHSHILLEKVSVTFFIIEFIFYSSILCCSQETFTTFNLHPSFTLDLNHNFASYKIKCSFFYNLSIKN